MGRTPITTTWTGRANLQNDLGYLLDDLAQILTDDLGNQILVHTGTFEDQDTTYFGRTAVTTSWT